jgi:hypothetical protein
MRHRHDRVAPDPDVTAIPWCAGPIHDARVADDEVVGRRLSPERGSDTEEKDTHEDPLHGRY